MTSFDKILIANRGEIAVRIAKTAQDLGYKLVAVYSQADEGALHAKIAHESVFIGPGPSSQSYLNIATLIQAAKTSGAQAIHPGYGFLSENAEFAQACEENDLVFIGPSSRTIALMGDKNQAWRHMAKIGVPQAPGACPQTQEAWLSEASEMGYPVMIKATAGGGGKGMRHVDSEAQLLEAVESCRLEAQAAFGNDALMLQKVIRNARHIEIQIFADTHGNVVHMGERDCSIQRRHQKIIEETPSPALNHDLRRKMGRAAVKAAKSIEYVGAGTVEFLLDPNGDFYFLEMNTRLQVEHGVTELLYGLDLVALQLRVAQGEALGFTQEALSGAGHAIEARLYAEDPARGFLPQSGRILAWEPAQGTGIRVDHGIIPGTHVSVHYDPMLAKFMAFGEDRETARRKLLHALYRSVFLGPVSNRDFLIKALEHPAFVKGEANTNFVENHLSKLKEEPPSESFMALAAVLFHHIDAAPYRGIHENWTNAVTPVRKLNLSCSDNQYDVSFKVSETGVFEIDGEEPIQFQDIKDDGHHVSFRENSQLGRAVFLRCENLLYLSRGGETWCVENKTYAAPQKETTKGIGTLAAVMDGGIRGVHVEPGQKVTKGQTLVVVEAMKMEHRMVSDVSGSVLEVHVNPGDQVVAGKLLVLIDPDESPSTQPKSQ